MCVSGHWQATASADTASGIDLVKVASLGSKLWWDAALTQLKLPMYGGHWAVDAPATTTGASLLMCLRILQACCILKGLGAMCNVCC
jgi:hypothetical protein